MDWWFNAVFFYSMNKDGNTLMVPIIAGSVGNIMGNFHLHDAMVRMSQDWKNREILVEKYGNNGSMGWDLACGYVTTEARLFEIAGYLLQDIEKNISLPCLNFDDTERANCLASVFPNLLSMVRSGISAGYATDIPPEI